MWIRKEMPIIKFFLCITISDKKFSLLFQYKDLVSVAAHQGFPRNFGKSEKSLRARSCTKEEVLKGEFTGVFQKF